MFKKTIDIWLLVLAGIFLFFVVPGHTEDFFRVKEDIMERAWIKTSLFYFSPGLRITNAGYNTNIYSYDYLETPDWIADAGIELNLALIFKNRLIIQVKEFPSYSFYVENDRERAFSNIFQLTAYTWAGRFNFKYQFEKPFVYQQVNPEAGLRIRRWETTHTLSTDYGSHDRFFFNLYLKQTSVAFEDVLLLNSFNMNQLFARTDYWLGLSVNKVIFTRTYLSFQYEYFDQRFEFIKQRNRTGRQFSLNIRFPAGSRIIGELRYGLRFVRPATTFYPDFLEPFGSGFISIRLMDRIRLHVNFRLDNQYSFAGADLYYTIRSIGGGFTYSFSRRIRAGYNYTTGERSYKSLTGDDETRRDYYNVSRLSLTVRVNRKTRLGVEYRVYRSDSTHLRFLRSYDYIGGYINYDF
ncbi:MAG: hypothetical protein GY950_21935 [bacterium]|nr:hypothetical protein [bacterium]